LSSEDDVPVGGGGSGEGLVVLSDGRARTVRSQGLRGRPRGRRLQTVCSGCKGKRQMHSLILATTEKQPLTNMQCAKNEKDKLHLSCTMTCMIV
jgi:hypothetical protein